MPILVRFFICHALVGMGIAALFVAAILGFDVGHIASMARDSSSGPLAILLLFVFSTITFASIQISMAVMLLPRDGDEGRGGGGGLKVPAWLRLPANPVAVRVPVQQRRRR